MLGWFEWDETTQRLRVVIPPWDCVDVPRQSSEVVQQRIENTSKRVLGLSLNPGHGRLFGSCFEHAATWLPDELLELGIEVLLAATQPGIGVVTSLQAMLQGLIEVPFKNLIAAGYKCEDVCSNLRAAAMMMSNTTRPVFMNDLISRAREQWHDDGSTAEPHASINTLLGKLEACLFVNRPGSVAPEGGALVPANAARIDANIRRLVRRIVFSMAPDNMALLLRRVQALEKNGGLGIFRHLAEEMDQIPANVPLYAVCVPLLNQLVVLESVKNCPDSQVLAREVLDQADAWMTACTAITYRFTRSYLVSLGDKRPSSPQLLQSHDLLTQHTRRAAQQRLIDRQRWLSSPTAGANPLTLVADPGAQATDDPVHTWPVERLVRWIDGPVTAPTATKAMSNADQLVVKDKVLLAQDRQRSNTAAPAKGQQDSQALTKAQAQEVVWQGLTQSAEYLRDELRDLGALADKLGLKGADRNNAATALKNIEAALQAMSSFRKTTNIGSAQTQLSAANSSLERLRLAIRPVQVAADRLLRFGDCLALQLRQETLVMGKHHGGVIASPMSMDQWGAVRDRFHRRYCSPVQVLVMEGERLLLRSDQALALHVTAGSQSGYAFDVSVHLWQRMEASKDDPFDLTVTEPFPPMNTHGWFDTFITCAVLHVPME